jgi:hypothetical protein
MMTMTNDENGDEGRKKDHVECILLGIVNFI